MEIGQGDRNGLVVGWVGSFICVHLCKFIFVRVCACVRVEYVHIRTHTYTYKHTNTNSVRVDNGRVGMRVCTLFRETGSERGWGGCLVATKV